MVPSGMWIKTTAFLKTRSTTMNYVAKLQEWFEREKRERGLVDIKFFPRYFMGVDLFPDEPPPDIEKMAKAVYETVTGKREAVPLDTSVL